MRVWKSLECMTQGTTYSLCLGVLGIRGLPRLWVTVTSLDQCIQLFL